MSAADTTTEVTISRILVPVDFSAHAERALQYATTIARRTGASVELVHVVEDPFSTGAWNRNVYVPNVSEVMQNVVKDAERQLAEWKARTASASLDVGSFVLTGRPSQAIVEHARKRGTDLIVMGTHGRRGLPHLVLGSVAEDVVRQATCPVLTVRNPQEH